MSDNLKCGDRKISDTFYCLRCGEHKAEHLLGRKTASGRKVCKDCDARWEAREEKRRKPGSADAEKNAKKRNQNQYKKGKLPKFMYS